MKYILMAVTFVVVAVGIGAAAYYIGYTMGQNAKKSEEPAAEEGKTATVVTAPARKAMMGRTVLGYGVVRAAPEAMRAFSVPFESRVRRFHVTPGQPVAPGTVLVEIDPSPATVLQVAQARSSVASATHKLDQAKQAAALAVQEARTTRDADAKLVAMAEQRLTMKLSTTQEVQQTRQELQLAEARLASLEKQEASADVLQAQADLKIAELQVESLNKLGISTPEIKCELAGVVDMLSAQEGQIVPAGGPLIQVAEGKRIEARLGIEPGEAGLLKDGMTVSVAPVQGNGGKPAEGRIRLVASRVNPASRLVDCFVTLPQDASLLLESYVIGRAVLDAKERLVVPRSAVLPVEGKYVLYTVEDERAVKHTVEIGLQDGDLVEVFSEYLSAGDEVVIEGNYVLEDNMEVEVKGAAEGTEKPVAKKPEEPRKKGDEGPAAPKGRTSAAEKDTAAD